MWYKLICTVSVVLMFGFAISATLEDSSGFTAFTVLCAVCFLALLGVIYYAHRGSPYGQEWDAGRAAAAPLPVVQESLRSPSRMADYFCFVFFRSLVRACPPRARPDTLSIHKHKVLIYSPHVFPIFEFDTMAKGKTNPLTEVNHRVWSVYAIFAVRTAHRKQNGKSCARCTGARTIARTR